MLNRSYIALLALALGVTLSGSALTQTMVGTIEVSDADLQYVTAHCVELHDAYEGEPSGVLPDYEVDPSLQVHTSVDLDSIQLSDCEHAGLLMNGAR